MKLGWDEARALRLARHHLHERAPRGGELRVAGRICGLHAQLLSSAALSLWARVEGATLDGFQRALWRERRMVKSWAMRGTLHLLPARDLPVFLGALATYDRYLTQRWVKYFGSSREEIELVVEAIGQSLRGRALTQAHAARLPSSSSRCHTTSRPSACRGPAGKLARLGAAPFRARCGAPHRTTLRLSWTPLAHAGSAEQPGRARRQGNDCARVGTPRRTRLGGTASRTARALPIAQCRGGSHVNAIAPAVPAILERDRSVRARRRLRHKTKPRRHARWRNVARRRGADGRDRESELVVGPTPSLYFTSREPGAREMNWGPVKTYGDTVPNDRFYVHNRTRPPKVDVGAWRLEVTGNAVAHPRSFTYDELLALPQVTLRRVLDCGANCRAFFPKLPRGGNGPRWLPIGFTQWHFGAVGAADWTGVRLSDVLAATGIDRAIGVKFTGLDSIPVERNEIPLRASHSGRQGPRERHAPGPPHERGRASNRSRLPGARESSRAGEATRP